MARDIPEIMNAANEALSGIEGNVIYVIADVSQLSLSFGDIVQGLASAFSPSSDVRKVPPYDNRVRAILIGSGTLIRLVAAGGRQDQYGNRQLEVFETLDEALAHIRQASITR